MQKTNSELQIQRDTYWFNTILPINRIKFKDNKSKVPHSLTSKVRWGINKEGVIYVSSVVINNWKSNENLIELGFEVIANTSNSLEGRSQVVLTEMILQLCDSKNQKKIQLTFS
jgi:hypothetical protein